jgi:hypothetical protein
MIVIKYILAFIGLAILFYEFIALIFISFLTLIAWQIPTFTSMVFMFWQSSNEPFVVIRGAIWFVSIGFTSMSLILIEEDLL